MPAATSKAAQPKSTPAPTKNPPVPARKRQREMDVDLEELSDGDNDLIPPPDDAWNDDDEQDAGVDRNETIELICRNAQTGQKKTIVGTLQGNTFFSSDGKTYSHPPPKPWTIISSKIAEEEDQNPDQWGQDADDDDSMQTIHSVIKKFKNSGDTGLRIALRDEYHVIPNSFNDREIERLVLWAKTNSTPNKAGRLMLIDIQVSFGKMKGVNVTQLRAKLMKPETGSNPFSSAMAIMTPKGGDRENNSGRSGRRDRDFRRDRNGRQQPNPPYDKRQCAHCGKQYHFSAQCRNTALPKNTHITPIPGCQLL